MKDLILYERIRIQENEDAMDLGEFLEINNLYIDIESGPDCYWARFADCSIKKYKHDRFAMGMGQSGNTPATALTALLVRCRGKVLIYAPDSSFSIPPEKCREIFVGQLINNFIPASEKGAI